ncbi:MAG: DUF4139 domain-containing protein [Desulfobacteraceae bacterium]|nr:DUF4139 domain-containing protein [Desulfobacteraceae bacterium]MBC2756980.1 DUF4139 domain-containing protein [Desulfobacteraceae bacterium]
MTPKTISFLKFSLLIFIALSVLLASNTHAKPVAAIIYPNDAKITEHHIADVQADGDRHKASFFLPIHANKETLTVNTAPGSHMRITSVNIEKQALPVADQVEALKNQLKNLNRKKSEFETRIKADIAYIDFWQTQAKNQPEKIEDIESVEKLGNAIKKGITQAYDEIFQYTQSLEELAEKIKKVRKQLNDLTGATKKRWQVDVYLSGKPQPKIDLTCSYHIRNCYWRPTYTLNALPAKSETELNWYAQITQNTGIDWEDVELKIATAQAVTRPEPPFLRDWIIQPRKEIVYSTARHTSSMAEESLMFAAPQLSADMAAGAPPPEPEQKAGFTFDTYDLGKRTIKAGESRRFTIREMVLNSDFKYLIRPHETPQAFLFAQLDIKDDDFIRLPNGDATYLVDSAFIAIRSFSMHDKEQKLFFGSDPQVDVKLTILEKKSNETGFLIGKKQYQWGWKVSINNLKAHKIAVLMEDAYPQIRDKRIKLKETFNGVAPQKEDNLLKWTFPVLPQTETAVEYGFSVTYPDEMDLSFGGR